jgi:intermembrane space import and assembly protein 40
MGASNSKELEESLWTGSGSKEMYKEIESKSSKKISQKEETKSLTRDRGGGDSDYRTGQEVDVNEEIEREMDDENFDPATAGPIFPDGNINWDCPCLGGAAYGPCGTEFRQAFSCFHFSKAEPKGTDCFPHFRDMHTCFSQYPELYGKTGDDDDEEDEDEDEEMFDEEELEVIDKESEEAKSEKEKTKAKAPSKEEKEKSKEEGQGQPHPQPPKKEKEAEGKPKEQVIPRGAAVL